MADAQRTHNDRLIRLEIQYEQHNEIISSIRETNDSIDESLKKLLSIRETVDRLTTEIANLHTDIDLFRDEAFRERNEIWKKVHKMSGEKEREHRQIDVRITSLEKSHENIKWTLATLAMIASLIGSLIGTFIT